MRLNERSRAVGMQEAGKTQLQHHLFMFPQSIISRLWNRYLLSGNCQRPKSGRPRCTTVRGLANVTKRHCFESAVKLNAEF